ncbi:glycoside hydrolase family 36 protein [Nonomuraea roseoviolacea]|uniref:Alpha-galactosidase n=1 Tax=Nonomuraea roseoviolacea subsp. carminata TaxID=160689 RepID=A0ABT1K8Z1_9ACTN|nr:glycoside hydrolase family 36 protein [Nonomuraea roseoviolacea]MCP2350489.1 alpha-galactosidase [Nonomuraea roseoviolacea subsp. carminata]
MPFAEVGEIRCDPERGRVFEHGWQSWSPTGSYRLGETPPRPADRNVQTICYRPETPAPDGVFQGEGLLAIDPGDGPVEVWSAPGPLEVPSIRARPEGDRLVVSADGPVRHTRAADLDTALRDWATTTAAGHVPEAFPAVPPMWCTWYGYWDKVTETDVLDNLRLLERHGLTADMILVDDGYEAGIGDWLDPRPGFGSLERAVGAVTGTGRRAGIWTAPFLAGHQSRLYREHPDWMVGGAHAGRMWDQDLAVLDVTHPDAAAHLVGVFRAFAALGITHFKLDYLYAGALAGRRHEDLDPVAAYRRGLELVREGAGPDATLHGCGAPMLPSIGLVDIMRVSPDIAPTLHPRSGDISQPSQLGARLTGAAREFLHARWWVNDPDCLIVRPEVEAREQWAAHVEGSGGLRGSSDPVAALDAWGLETTRRLLTPTRTDPS